MTHASDLSKLSLIGYLAKDPETRLTKNDKEFVRYLFIQSPYIIERLIQHLQVILLSLRLLFQLTPTEVTKTKLSIFLLLILCRTERPAPIPTYHRILCFSESPIKYLSTLKKGTRVYVEANFELREPEPDADPTTPQGQRQIFLRHGVWHNN